MLEAIVEIIFEFLLQLIFEVAAELGLHTARDLARGGGEMPLWIALIGYPFLGAALGFISLFIYPYRLVPHAPVPGVSLVVAPVLAGLSMWGIGWLRRRKQGPVIRLNRFSYGFIFALAMSIVRFWFTK